MFTHLHVHSHYSLLDGLSKIDGLVARAKELGMKSLALTDHGAMYGVIEFYEKARKAGIKPILGCEIYLAPNSMRQKRGKIDTHPYHLVLLAKNNEGYKNLIKIVTASYIEGYYYKPRVDFDFLKKHTAGLIALSACIQGEIAHLVISGKMAKAEARAKEYEEVFGKGNFYLEIQNHPNIENQNVANRGIIKIAKKNGIPLVATCDSHYLLKSDAEVQDILLCIQTQTKVADTNRLTMMDEDFSLKSPEEMVEAFKDTPEAIANTEKIAEICNIEIELKKLKLPHFSVPQSFSADSYLKKLCYEGLAKKFRIKEQDNKIAQEQKNDKGVNAEILKRLEYELKVIEKTGFAPYLLIVQDYVNWAKNNKIVVGPGRGSAAGSIVCYLLNITEIDPIKYDLLFERFLNPERISMPDIDLDFADTRRDEVIEYVRKKYGADHVAQIVTFGKMAARAAVRDVVRVLGYPYGFGDQISKMIPMQFNAEQACQKIPDLKSLYNNNSDAKKILDYAKRLEGVARHASMHACGVVMAPDDLNNFVPRQFAPQNENIIITQYEMHAIEDLGLLKMDLLGLKNLTIIQTAIKIIEKVRKEKVDIGRIPFDDKKTYELLQRANTTGVFQLECLSGETIVSNTTIKKLFERKNKKILESVYVDEGKVHKNKIFGVFKSGKKETYTLIADNNWYIKATKDHNFLTAAGWKKLGEIKNGDSILMKTNAKHLIYNTCQTCGKQISGQEEGQSQFCYKCSAKFYKNPSKIESRKKIREARIKFYKNGGKPWNIGIITENNEIWKKTAEKISKALTGKTLEDRYGKKMAEEIKHKLSKRFSGKNNPMFGKPSPHRVGGFRKDLGHYVRSSWEADFARILKLNQQNYQYEPKTFQLKRKNGETLGYTPDFYIPSKNTFYEIKGWLRDLDNEKIKLFQKQYPQYNFILVSATKFAEFALKYKNLIAWECPKIPHHNFEFIKVKEVKRNGVEDTYDIAMQAPGNNFVANGFVVHNSSGMKRYLKQLVPTEFENIIAMVALYRPGPIEWIPEYVLRKHARKVVSYLHPKLENALKKTYGVPIYQEQVMQVAQDIAGFTLAEADVLRKAVGKKIKHLLLEQKRKFLQGAVANNITKTTAEEIFSFIEPFAGYGFNKSHATCYATIAYQTAYLKTHYPAEFMAALLTSDQEDLDRIAIEIEECRDMGLEVLPPDVNESFNTFAVVKKDEKNVLRFALNGIKNLGNDIAEQIVEERKKNGKYKDFDDFINRLASQKFNKKCLESLAKSGALDSFIERNQVLKNTERILTFSKNTLKAKEGGQSSLFAKFTAALSPKLRLEQAPAASKKDRLAWEKELLGLYISSHPLIEYREFFDASSTPCSKLRAMPGRRNFSVGGIINKIKKIITKNGEPMLFVDIEDLTGRTEILIFPRVLKENTEIWQEGRIILVSGRLSEKDGETKILCEKVREITAENVKTWKNSAAFLVYKMRKENELKNGTQGALTTSKVEITLPPGASMAILYQFKEIFDTSPGIYAIHLRIPDKNGNFKVIPTKAKVDISNGLLGKIEQLVGKERVRVYTQ